MFLESSHEKQGGCNDDTKNTKHCHRIKFAKKIRKRMTNMRQSLCFAFLSRIRIKKKIPKHTTYF